MTADGGADPLVAVGKVGPPVGLKGDVYVQPWTDAPQERFAPGSVLRTEPDDVGPLTVAACRFHGSRFVVRFEFGAHRTSAEALRDVQLLVAATDRPALDDPDDFYDSDLVGLAAITSDGRALGAVREVVHSPASDYLVLDHDGREVLVPFVAAIVPEVDIAGGRVVITPPDGLLDL